MWRFTFAFGVSVRRFMGFLGGTYGFGTYFLLTAVVWCLVGFRSAAFVWCSKCLAASPG